jgi:uncharacterized protein (TIGR02246 family)
MQALKCFSVAFITLYLLVRSPLADAEQESANTITTPDRVSGVVEVSEAAQASNAPDKSAIESTIAGYFDAMNHSNIEAALRLYTDDPVLLPFLVPSVVGTDAVRKEYETTFRDLRFQVHTSIQELVQMSPNWAYVRTDSAGTVTPTKTGKGAPSTFHELFLLRKTSDGSWRIARYSFSPTAPPPAL